MYRSRALPFTQDFAQAVLCDLGSAVDGTVLRHGNVQPRIYRAPEVVLGAPWGYGIDIWSVGILVSLFRGETGRTLVQRADIKRQAWEFMEGEHLFDGGRQAWNPERYLGQMVALMGKPPAELLARGSNSEEWFDDAGKPSLTFPLSFLGLSRLTTLFSRQLVRHHASSYWQELRGTRVAARGRRSGRIFGLHSQDAALGSRAAHEAERVASGSVASW